MTAWILAAMLAAAAGQAGRAAPPPARLVTAQIDGHVAVLFDVVPPQDAVELRPELRLDVSGSAGRGGRVRFGVDALAQGIAASRKGRSITAAVFRPRDAWIEIAGDHVDVRAGYGRVIWGRLDEVQPSDAVNPIDASRFLLEGRSAARLPVWFARGRLMPSDRFTLEGIVVPVFRRGTFDELDEDSSPFNLAADALPPGLPVRVERVEPPTTWRHVSGGGRMSTTIGRVDVGGAVFRGFDGFGVMQLEATPGGVVLRERHTRFTMVAGDFETVAGEWALRGEAALFTDKTFAGVSRSGLVQGRSLEAGVGFDRRAGDLRVFGTLFMQRQWSGDDPRVAATDVSLIGSIERAFSRERYRARLFAVVNPADAAGFVRGLFTWSVRDNVTLDASAAAFVGAGDDLISRFQDRDFAFTRVTWFF